MQNALLLGQCVVNSELGSSFMLHYYLLNEKASYGLKVVKTISVDNQEIKEEEIVSGISDSLDYVKELAECLKCNVVTPICTREVIDDYIS